MDWRQAPILTAFNYDYVASGSKRRWRRWPAEAIARRQRLSRVDRMKVANAEFDPLGRIPIRMLRADDGTQFFDDRIDVGVLGAAALHRAAQPLEIGAYALDAPDIADGAVTGTHDLRVHVLAGLEHGDPVLRVDVHVVGRKPGEDRKKAF